MKEKKVKEVEVKEEKEEVKKVEEKDEKLKKVLRKAWDIFFWVCVAILVFIWISDFINVKNDKSPKYCIKTETVEVSDGTVDSCLGLGYKIFTYHTSKYEGAREFGPFWATPRE